MPLEVCALVFEYVSISHTYGKRSLEFLIYSLYCYIDLLLIDVSLGHLKYLAIITPDFPVGSWRTPGMSNNVSELLSV